MARKINSEGETFLELQIFIDRKADEMISILLLTHGGLANGFISALNLIVGEVEKIDVLELYHGKSIEEYREEVKKKIQELDDGSGVLVFCDIFGASPYNTTAHAYKELRGKVDYRSITGINLPMIIEATSAREIMNLDELNEHIQHIGKDGIKELFTIVGKEE